MTQNNELFNRNKPLIIAGPCSAESREQMFECAEALAKTGKVDAFRSGVWKPRTRPGQFEGLGETALQWLTEIKQQFNLPVITEIATPQHLEKCLKYGIDMLWIGARTSGNPFSINEIAEALRGVNIPVFVKNPPNPDLELWIGAIERIKNSGIRTIAAIHRGFYPYRTSIYRNIPQWEIAIELKIRYPDLPILCDPSHIAGDHSRIFDVAQYAFDIMMNGLMIEVHPNPEVAKTDALQQITPQRFNEIMNLLQVRNQTSNSTPSVLDQYRMQIDSIDYQLIELLGKRFEISYKIAEFKKQNRLAPFQINRWKQIIETRQRQAEAVGLNPDFILQLLQCIHKESISVQNRHMQNSTPQSEDPNKKK